MLTISRQYLNWHILTSTLSLNELDKVSLKDFLRIVQAFTVKNLRMVDCHFLT